MWAHHRCAHWYIYEERVLMPSIVLTGHFITALAQNRINYIVKLVEI
jgi:hypothetical protein